MSDKKLKETEVKIDGMTCGSCELLIERNLKKIPGIVRANVNHSKGVASIVAESDRLPSFDQIEAAIKSAGYCISGKKPEQSSNRENFLSVRVAGMTDKNCELLIKEKLKLVDGVKYTSVAYAKGIAKIHYMGQNSPSWDSLCAAVESAGFRLSRIDEVASEGETPRQKWTQIGASLIIIFAIYEILKTFDVVSFVSSSTSGAMTFGGILLIGLVAGTSSCLAVTGGLLLSVAAKYNEANQSQTRWQKFKPLLYFNMGRLVSYFMLGGLVGVIGKSITISPRVSGIVSISVAAIMLYLALSILKIIPKKGLPLHFPKRFSHWIANMSESRHPVAPFGLGMLTFFLPCGFTQSLQFVALASGSFFSGAMTMFIFALGTLPALLGISAISSTAKGGTSRLFLRFSGTLVLILALFNLNSGLMLVGVDAANILPSIISGGSAQSGAEDPNVTHDPDGTQVINMDVSSYGYSPNSFTVVAGQPTVVKAKASSNAGGCASVLTVPDFKLLQYLSPGTVTTLGPFTPTKDFLLTCSMGMFRANVKVVKGTGADTAAPAINQKESAQTTEAIPPNSQIVDLKWTKEGYVPQIIEVKSGSPVAVKISSTAPAGGCMGTVVFPIFNKSAFVPQPGSEPTVLVLDTKKVEPGYYPFTCGMGIRMGTLYIN